MRKVKTNNGNWRKSQNEEEDVRSIIWVLRKYECGGGRWWQPPSSAISHGLHHARCWKDKSRNNEKYENLGVNLFWRRTLQDDMTKRDGGITYNVMMLLLLLLYYSCCFLCCFQFHFSNTVTLSFSLSVCLSLYFTPVSRTALLTSSPFGRWRPTEAGAGGGREKEEEEEKEQQPGGDRWSGQVATGEWWRDVLGGIYSGNT